MYKHLKENIKYIRHYGVHSLSIRSFITIFLILLVPLMSISYLVYKNDEASFNKEMAAANYQLLSNIQQTVDSSLRELERLANQVLANDDIEIFSKLSYERLISYDRMRLIRSLNNNLALIAATYEYMDSIRLVALQSGYVLSPKSTARIEDISDLSWLIDDDSKAINNLWTVQSDGLNNKVIYTQNVSYDNAYKAIVVMEIDIERLMSTMSHFENHNHQFAVVDEFKQIVFSNKTSMEQQEIDNVLSNAVPLKDGNENSFYMTHNYPSSMVTKIDSIENGWTYLLTVPFEAYQDIQSGYTAFMVLLVTSCLVIALISSLLITIRSVSPINRIMAMIEGKYKEDSKESSGNPASEKSVNELKYILQAIKETNMERAEMSLELERRYEVLRNARKIALQSQINPHFLFNALESINWKVLSLTMEENEASVMIQQLSRLLEFSLESSSNFIEIPEEIEHAKLYIDFQKKRYKNSFEVKFNIDSGIEDYCCISLMLQPIIENAIYHGIKPCEAINQIVINVYFEEEIIMFEVLDDGVGIPPERLSEIRNDLMQEDITDNHIGLANVNQRLCIIFGEHYGLDIISEFGDYTKVKISIPKVEKRNLL